MTDYDDYENNLAFPSAGDWSDKGITNTTNRTESTLLLVDKVEELTKWLDLKSEYIVKLEQKNGQLEKEVKKLKALLEFYWGDMSEYMGKDKNNE